MEMVVQTFLVNIRLQQTILPTKLSGSRSISLVAAVALVITAQQVILAVWVVAVVAVGLMAVVAESEVKAVWVVAAVVPTMSKLVAAKGGLAVAVAVDWQAAVVALAVKVWWLSNGSHDL
jgi:hypothetical protein